MRRGRVGGVEDHAALGQAIEVRRRLARVAVRADVIGAQRVDGDQDQIAPAQIDSVPAGERRGLGRRVERLGRRELGGELDDAAEQRARSR